MKFAKGIDHRLIIDGDDVICKAGERVPQKHEEWFLLRKPSWVVGKPETTKEGVKKSPSDKRAKTEAIKKKIKPMSTRTNNWKR